MLNINKILKTNHAVLWIISMMMFSNTSFGFAGTISLENKIITTIKEKPNPDSLNLTVFPSGQDKGQIGYSEYKNIDIPDDNIFKFDIDNKFDFYDNVWLEFDLYGVSDIGSVAFSINDNPSIGGYIVSKSDKWTKQRISLNPQWLSKGINRIQFSKLTENYSIKNLKMIVDKVEKSNKSIVLYNDMNNYPSYDGKVYIFGFINSPDKKVKNISINSKEIQIVNNSFEMIYKLSNQERSENKLLLNVYFEDGNKETREIILSETGEKGNKLLDKVDMIQTQQYSLISNKEFEIDESDFSFILPENSLINDLNLTVTKLRQKDLPPMNMDITNVTAYHAGYRFLPHGHHFTEEGAILKLAYDKSSIPKGYSEADIQTFYFDIEKSKWISLKRDSIDTKNGFVYSRVQHFTDYINGVIASPESAESTNFTSTYFSDLLKANPMSGIRLINPPSAVPTGEAGVSYPIDVPQGRNGLQPSMAVTYSSDAGSSWVGYGWNLSIPSIDVETRWGVPRYETNKESDAYLLAGQQLVTLDDSDANATPTPYLPHRRDHSNWIDRTEDRRFYNRVESPAGFDKIIRHGNSPTNYWWEVTDRNGTIYYYGSSDGTNLNNNYVIKTSVGNNIAKWLLTKVTDTYGNYILYTYDKTSSDLGNGVMATSVYPKNITYSHTTTSNGTENKNEIIFKLEVDNNTSPPTIVSRDDISLDARTGALILDNRILSSIEVKSAGLTARKYEFIRGVGRFKKTMLEKLIAKDANNAEIYNHEFSYFDEIQDDGFTAAEDWDTGKPDDILDANSDIGYKSGDKEFTPLGGGESSVIGGSLYVGAGVPLGGGKRGTVGGTFGFTDSNSKGRVQFLDINGDGLPDKVYNNGSELVYRPNKCRTNQAVPGIISSKNFGDQYNLSGVGTLLSATEDNAYNYGITAHFSAFTAGVSYSRSRSETNTYLNDINGDGFIDFVEDGTTLFNESNPLTSFTDINFGTPVCSPLTSPEQSTITGLYSVTAEEQNDFYNEHPRLDVVKAWRAPFTGSVVIPQTTITNIGSVTVDGYKVYIQHETNEPAFSGDKNTTGNQDVTISVNKGETIYFRASSGDDITANGQNDEIEWDVAVNYTNAPIIKDVYGNDYGKFKFSNDAIPNKVENYNSLSSHDIIIQAEINISSVLSDKLRFEILKNGDPIIDPGNMPVNCGYQATSTPIGINYTITGVNQGDIITFRLASNSNIDWNEISVNSLLLEQDYNATYIDTNGDPQDITPAETNSISGDDVPIEYYFFNEIDSPSNIDYPTSRVKVDDNLVLPPNTTDKYTLNINNMSNTLHSVTGEFFISIKDDNTTYFQSKYTYQTDASGNVTTGTPEEIINIPITTVGTEIYATIQYPNPLNSNNKKVDVSAGFIEDITLSLVSDPNRSQQLTPTHYGYDGSDRFIFNSLYRGWSVFAYNPDADGVTTDEDIIDVAKLNFNDYEGDYSNYSNGQPGGPYDPKKFGSDAASNSKVKGSNFHENVVFPMKCLPTGGISGSPLWKVLNGENTSASLTTHNPSRLLEDDALLTNSLSSSGTSSYPGITMETKSKGKAFSGGASIGVADGSVTLFSEGTTENTIEYIDLNGDRIPDIIGNSQKIGYTFSNGEIESRTTSLLPTGTSNKLVAPSTPPNLNIGFGSNIIQSFSSKSSIQGGKQSVSCGLNANLSANESKSEIFWLDVNGDGLPDQVNSNDGSETVMYNLGYSFTDPVSITDIPDKSNKNNSESVGLGLGFSLFSGSFTGGVGYNKTAADGKSMFTDVNGDGLTDYIYIDLSDNNKIKLSINTGNGFTPYSDYKLDGLTSETSRTQMIGTSVNIAFTIAFNVLGVQFAITPGANAAASLNRVNATFSDIDGDGFVDFISSTAPNPSPPKMLTALLEDINPASSTHNNLEELLKYEDSDKLTVRRSLIRRTNKLKSVKNSIGGQFEIDYAQTPATVKHPNGKFVMSSVIMNDGFAENGNDPITNFEYDDGYYDRCERTFLGFSKVNTIQMQTTTTTSNNGTTTTTITPYRTIANEYINTNIYQKGLMTKSSVIEGDYTAQSIASKTTTNQYTSRTVVPGANNTYSSAAAPADLSLEKEAIINTMLESTGTELNMNGNIGETASMIYDDYGNIISYTYDNGSGGYTTKIGYFIKNSKNILGVADTMKIPGLRKKIAAINDKGKITKLTVYLNAADESITNYDYDSNGNLTKITLPDAGGRPYYEYEYESTLNTFVSKITDNFGFESYNNNYDYRFGVPLEVIDINGNTTSFTYDDAGRITGFTGPPTFGGSYGANFSYDISASPISATTERHVPESNGTIKSVIYADGFGRTLQTVTQAVVDGEAGTIFSGIPEYDDFGRVVKTYYPAFGSEYDFNSTASGKVTTTEYDILDRKTKETLPGSRVFRYKYSNDGNNLKTELTDANTKTSSTISEYNGPVVSQTSNMGYNNTDYTTNFTYDAINQLKTITPPNGNPSSFVYDLAGRVTSRTTPDAGTTSYTYDAMGNITQQTNQWPINYVYEYGRLKNVNYGEHSQLNVEYEYDDNTSGLKGRVFQIKDGTGSQRFTYGTMGEITKIERSIAIPYKTDAAEFVTEWKYDLWNRVQKMTYPDGEIVTFNYDAGGNLLGFSGVKSGNAYDYVTDIQYDEFGSRKKLVYGNGVVTNYTYKSDERWAETINSQFSGSSLNVTYSSYDKMGNIFSISKEFGNQTNTGNQTFTYDDNYRLLTSSGDWNGSSMFPNQSCGTNGFTSSYNSEYTYDNMGNILSKMNNINKSTPVNSPYSKYTTLNYSYNGNKISSIQEIYNSDNNGINTMTRKAEHTYAYDASGNTTSVVQELNDTNNGGVSTSLEVKRGIVWQEGNLMRALADDNVVTHFVYDANGERVLKLSEAYHQIFVNSELSGDGSFDIGYTMYVNPYMTVRHDGHYTKHFYIGKERVVSKVGATDDYGTDPTALGLGLPNGKRGSLESLMGKNYNDLNIDITFSSISAPDLGLSGGSGKVETDRYFFTKDHIGSSSIITDATGKPIQQIEYMPFGESYVDWRELSWNTPYRFTGKEQDAETGLYYYGARYYDPKIGRFMSVDPLADKYPGWNPYNYTMNNPINTIDPDGRDTIRISDKFGTPIATFNHYSPNINYTANCEVSCDFEEIVVDVPVDMDIAGIGINGSATALFGGSYGIEFIAFLDGKDAGTVEAYEYTSQNLGLYAGVGVYGILGDFQGSKGDDNLTTDDYLGKFLSYSADFTEFGVGYFWGNKNNSFELWPGYLGFGGKTTWQGFTFTSGDVSIGLLPSSLKFGLQFSEANYKHARR